MDGLDDQVIETAQKAHPFTSGQRGGYGAESSASHSAEPARPFDGALDPPRAPVHEIEFSGEDLGGLRRFLASWAAGEGLSRDATEDLVLAINELATNSVLYGGGRGTLLTWREQNTLLCEIQDAGHIRDPLIGRSRPAPEQHTGRGLWLVHQLSDLVQICSSESGTAIRVHKRCGEEGRP